MSSQMQKWCVSLDLDIAQFSHFKCLARMTSPRPRPKHLERRAPDPNEEQSDRHLQ
jgi:hypothetical protein